MRATGPLEALALALIAFGASIWMLAIFLAQMMARALACLWIAAMLVRSGLSALVDAARSFARLAGRAR